MIKYLPKKQFECFVTWGCVCCNVNSLVWGILYLCLLYCFFFFFSSNLSVVLLILPFREFYICYVSLPLVYFIHVWI
jgi:hypothetical protein